MYAFPSYEFLKKSAFLNFYTNILFVVKQYNSSTKTHWQITTVYSFITSPLEWAFKALLNVVCMGYIGMPVCICCVCFRQNSTSNYFSIMRQLLDAFWISSIQDTRLELTELQWIRPMATWHPLQSSVLHDKVMCEFTISFLDSKWPFEGLIEGLFENAPKLFWPCCLH
jgi:hypothetical protein